MLRKLLYETFAAAGVCVTTVHEAMDKHFLQSVRFCNITKCKQVIKRRMHSSIRGQPHEMDSLAVVTGIREGAFHFGVIHNAAVLACFVYLDQILIDHSAGSYIEVSYLAVSHLTVGQANIFATRLKLRVGVVFNQIIPVRCRCRVNDIAF